MLGPAIEASVRRVLVMPMTAVRSSGRTTAAISAVRGAWSIMLRPARTIRSRTTAQKAVGGGSGKNSTAADDGACVNTIVLTRPILRARGPANTAEMAPSTAEKGNCKKKSQ